MIHVLPPEVANQIAAGEVVERPASVVKELVENAIDAGATHIEVSIEEGGTKLIKVSDNGKGMSREDAAKCFLRHATSKIQSIDDLFSIQSFGFRGEALAAISSVSHFEITTKTQDGEALHMIIEEGKIKKESQASANKGTTIIVRDLFHTTPARLGYLKRDETEYRQAYKEVQNFAISHPEISFKVFKDEKLTLDLPSVDKKIIRIQQVLKVESGALLEITQEAPNIKVSGFSSMPGHFAGNKNHQHLFVNGRKIEDHRLAYAAREAYVQSCGIEKHLYPLFVLFIEIDPILVDVNVHPRKLEVKFSDPGDVFSLVKSAITTAVVSNSENQSSTTNFSNRFTPKPISKSNYKSAQTFNESLFKAPSFAERHTTRESRIKNLESENNSQVLKSESSKVNNQHKGLTFLAQLDRKYILARNESGDLYLFEQHALHERQRFDRFMDQYQKQAISKQPLLVSDMVSLREDEISVIHQHQAEITKMGFEISIPQDDTLEIQAVPEVLKSENFKIIFEDLAQYFSDEQIGEHSIDKMMRKLLEYKACRGSIMFGDRITPEEGQQLLDDFEKSRWRDLCPHGRPNHVQFSAEEIAKWFHR